MPGLTAFLSLSLVLAGSACREGAGAASRDDGGPSLRRYRFANESFDARGFSRPIHVPVPERTRSLAVVVEGDPRALYALAELRTPDRIEHVLLPVGIDVGAAMRAAYFDERSGEMPGELRQSIRLGLFSHIYPDRPGAELPVGDVALRIATSDPSRSFDLEIVLAEEDGGTSLPVNIIMVSREVSRDAGLASAPRDADSLPFIASLRSILAGGGVELRVERILSLVDRDLGSMTELSEPQEPPTSASSRLALLGGAMTDGRALNVFIVDSLPPGVGGWTLGTPGPAAPDTYYSGVVAAHLDGGDELARVLAHELCHYLGLWHVEHVSRSGAIHADPLDDTEPGTGNLMDEEGKGTRLTPDQSYVLSRHPLLTATGSPAQSR